MRCYGRRVKIVCLFLAVLSFAAYVEVKAGPYIGGRAEGAAAPARKSKFFSNIVFEFAELFLVGCSKITRKSTNELKNYNIYIYRQ